MESVLFDFGGTLDADGTTWLDRFYPIYKEAGLTINKDSFAKAFYRSDDTLAERHALKGLSLEKTLNLQVEEVLALLDPARRHLRDPIVARFLGDCRVHFARNRPVLERLAKRFRLGIVSNFYGNLDGVLESEGLRRYFGTVADSGVIGTSKPEAAIFLHALKDLGSSPARAVMVGDSIPRDMRGAEGLGMPHAWIAPAGGSPCCGKAWAVKSLSELEPLLA